MKAEQLRDYTIAMVNDEDRQRTGKLRLVFTDATGKELAAEEQPFTLSPLGAQSYTVTLKAPGVPGSYLLQAIATPQDGSTHLTISRREVILKATASTK